MLAACWLAVVKAGLIAVGTMPLPRAQADDRQSQSDRCAVRRSPEAELAVTIDPASEHYAPDLKTVVYFNDAAPDALEARAARKPAHFAAHPSHRDDICLIAFTSGTTGQPKGTVLSSRHSGDVRCFHHVC